jgi:glycosyltransferase involved in cell wall biosynthesis
MRATTPKRPPDLISIVIPVFNGEEHLGEQLEALASQAYRGRREVVIVDNGCTDRTLQVARRWQQILPDLTVVDASGRRGVNHARNTGAAAARGDFLAFCDADDVVDGGWLAALAAAAAEADIVAGALDSELLNDPLCRSWIPPVPEGLSIKHRFLPAFPGGNCGLWTSVARDLAWDESFVFGSSDIEFSWRAHLAGYQVRVVPEAVVHRRCRRKLAGIARQWYRYGVSGPHLYRAFRSAGMARASLGSAMGSWAWLLINAPRALGSRSLRGHWVRVAARSAGSVVGSARCRVLFLEAPELPAPS